MAPGTAPPLTQRYLPWEPQTRTVPHCRLSGMFQSLRDMREALLWALGLVGGGDIEGRGTCGWTPVCGAGGEGPPGRALRWTSLQLLAAAPGGFL